MGISASFRKPRAPAEADHGVVFRDDAAFCGWPFYRGGLWALPGGEVLAGFKRIPSTYGAAAEISHTRLTVGQGRLVTIRSADGGARFDPGSLNVVFDLGTSAEEICGRAATTTTASRPSTSSTATSSSCRARCRPF